jgi:hypothetical protein
LVGAGGGGVVEVLPQVEVIEVVIEGLAAEMVAMVVVAAALVAMGVVAAVV